MSASADSKLVIYDVHGARLGEATTKDGEVVFPDSKFRWTWVLDARHEPYASLTLPDTLKRAEHARKLYVLRAE